MSRRHHRPRVGPMRMARRLRDRRPSARGSPCSREQDGPVRLDRELRTHAGAARERSVSLRRYQPIQSARRSVLPQLSRAGPWPSLRGLVRAVRRPDSALRLQRSIHEAHRSADAFGMQKDLRLRRWGAVRLRRLLLRCAMTGRWPRRC
jgi:hypothetical protein